MADEPEAEPVTEATPPADGETRIGKLEAKVDAILDKLSGAKPGEAAEEKPGMTLAEEIRAQLDARDNAEAERQAKDGEKQRIAELEARVTGMAEKAPEAPIRRVERLMGWR